MITWRVMYTAVSSAASEHHDAERPGFVGRGEQHDLVLRPEAGERRDTGDRQPADDERAARDGHETGELAHPADVLLFMHPVDDRARAEEQQRLEKRMGHHVEHAAT